MITGESPVVSMADFAQFSLAEMIAYTREYGVASPALERKKIEKFINGRVQLVIDEIHKQCERRARLGWYCAEVKVYKGHYKEFGIDKIDTLMLGYKEVCELEGEINIAVLKEVKKRIRNKFSSYKGCVYAASISTLVFDLHWKRPGDETLGNAKTVTEKTTGMAQLSTLDEMVTYTKLQYRLAQEMERERIDKFIEGRVRLVIDEIYKQCQSAALRGRDFVDVTIEPRHYEEFSIEKFGIDLSDSHKHYIQIKINTGVCTAALEQVKCKFSSHKCIVPDRYPDVLRFEFEWRSKHRTKMRGVVRFMVVCFRYRHDFYKPGGTGAMMAKRDFESNAATLV